MLWMGVVAQMAELVDALYLEFSSSEVCRFESCSGHSSGNVGDVLRHFHFRVVRIFLGLLIRSQVENLGNVIRHTV